jgi:hypothetical protein
MQYLLCNKGCKSLLRIFWKRRADGTFVAQRAEEKGNHSDHTNTKRQRRDFGVGEEALLDSAALLGAKPKKTVHACVVFRTFVFVAC